mmetsp:Transcript_47977/g.133865  ORF Transcript_47977/g.133865 Transcript_47977/m.133865 type:complete len:131 (+) Transcript_47977:91-483(+)
MHSYPPPATTCHHLTRQRPTPPPPMRLISKSQVYQPCTVCGWTLGIMFFITFALGVFNAGGLSEQSGYDWDISTTQAVINADMITSGESDVDDISISNSTERTDASYYITIQYNKISVREGKGCSRRREG